MTASALAATVGNRLADDGGATLTAYLLVLAGGLVEGAALGGLQAWALRDVLDRAHRWRWALATLLFAGVGWAAGSAPATLAGGDQGGTQPAWWVIAASAAAMGGGLGLLLGAAQAWAARGAAPHPWRWVLGSAAGWAPAMAVIFLGATAPADGWSLAAVVATGTLTGLVAGALLGLVSGAWVGSLDGLPVHHRVVLGLLATPLRGVLGSGMTALRVTGARTGRQVAFPVMYADDAAHLVVVPGRAERKTWWRNLPARPVVEVLLDGRWEPAWAELMRPGDVGYTASRQVYQVRWPRAVLALDQVLVRITRAPAAARGPASDTGRPESPPLTASTR